MDTHEHERAGAGTPSLLSRRTIALGAVWSVPVILAATAAPAAAASLAAPPPTPLAVTAIPTLAHTSARDYALTMQYTVSGGTVGEITTVAITQISTLTRKGTVYFTPLPPAESMTAGTKTVVSTVTRQGSSAGRTATVYYTYTTLLNGLPTTRTATATVQVS